MKVCETLDHICIYAILKFLILFCNRGVSYWHCIWAVHIHQLLNSEINLKNECFLCSLKNENLNTVDHWAMAIATKEELKDYELCNITYGLTLTTNRSSYAIHKAVKTEQGLGPLTYRVLCIFQKKAIKLHQVKLFIPRG